ncbi:CapA family protein [Micromonospora sp. NPDC048830]|uniref:CapA family protein n=1 Tax=Micromonospora sp. NPDC048830 TaxID=3364257 RepID=UPI003710B9CD
MILRAIGDTSINRPISPRVRALLHGGEGAADLLIGNLEIPLTDSGWPADKVSVSRSVPGNAREYAALDVDVWSLATNHALDWGVPGLLQTMAELDATGVRFVGAGRTLVEALTPCTLTTASGERVAVLNFCSTLPSGSAATPRRPGVAPLRVGQSFEFEAARMEEQPGSPPRMTTWSVEEDLARAADLVAAARATHDHVIVCLHWGVAWPFLPPNQGPLADYQRPVAHRLIDAGATAILGTHSHSLHPIEFYAGGVVLYSMGNFLFHNDPALPPNERRRTPPLHPILRTGPWLRGAVFDIAINGSDVSSVTIRPVVLDEDGEPCPADTTQHADILADIVRQSPGVHHDHGVFRP